jgi:hypothetical protein
MDALSTSVAYPKERVRQQFVKSLKVIPMLASTRKKNEYNQECIAKKTRTGHLNATAVRQKQKQRK